MSVDRARRVNTSRPSLDFKLRTTLRLPRFTALKLGLSAPTAPGIWRVESPAGGSILITSAPRSASSIAQKGPAITCVASSTRRPSSAFMKPFVLDGGILVHRAHDVRRRRSDRPTHLRSAGGAQRDDVGDV